VFGLPPGLALETSRPLDLFQVFLEFGNPVRDQAPVDFKLGFAGTAEKPEAAPLALKMGP